MTCCCLRPQRRTYPTIQDLEELKEGAVLFQPQITSVHNQSAVSVHKQTMALNTCINAIDQQHNQQASHPNCFVLLGTPGAGETHILLIAMTYALSRNMRALLVAITSERARRLGGIHIHMLSDIPVVTACVQTVQHIVSKALISLSKKPVKWPCFSGFRCSS